MLHSLSISSPSIHQYQYQHQQQQQYQQQQQPRHSLLSALLHQPLHRRELSCYHRFFHLSHDHRFHYTTTTDSKDKESSGSVEQGISESRNQDHNINGGQHNQEGVKSESHNSNDDSDTNDSTHINMNDGKNDGHEEDTHAGGENRTESILDALLLVVHFWVIITLFRRYVADISMVGCVYACV